MIIAVVALLNAMTPAMTSPVRSLPSSSGVNVSLMAINRVRSILNQPDFMLDSTAATTLADCKCPK